MSAMEGVLVASGSAKELSDGYVFAGLGFVAAEVRYLNLQYVIALL